MLAGRGSGAAEAAHDGGGVVADHRRCPRPPGAPVGHGRPADASAWAFAFSSVGSTSPFLTTPWGVKSRAVMLRTRTHRSVHRGRSGELEALRAADPELVTEDSASLGAALGRVLERLEDGDRALVVGHSPTNEAAVLGLTGQVVARWPRGPACWWWPTATASRLSPWRPDMRTGAVDQRSQPAGFRTFGPSRDRRPWPPKPGARVSALRPPGALLRSP